MAREDRIAVYGMGYVGKAVAAVFLRAGFHIVGVDVSEERVDELNRGVVKHAEAKVREAIQRGLREGSFRCTLDGVKASSECRVKIITVPVHLCSDGTPDFTSLKAAVEDAGRGARRGDLVVVESSVPPGTTVRIVSPSLEKVSGLRVEDELLLAYSPERVYVGRAVEDIEERYPKVVAGIGPRSTEAARALYERVAKKGVIVMSSPTAAELEKLAEGVYRDVNIALANELAKLAAALGVDYSEVRAAANTQPFCHLHAPGVGVGGSCIPVYPRFLTYTASELGLRLPLIELARQINLSMPGYTAELVDAAVQKLRVPEPRIAVLGLAFRGGIDDTRLSPTYDLIDRLMKRGYERLIVHDPYVVEDARLSALGIPLTADLGEAVRERDVVVVATDHPEYAELTPHRLRELAGTGRLAIVDGRLVVKEWRTPPQGVIYVGIGRPLVEGG